MIKYYEANVKVTEVSAEQITISTMGVNLNKSGRKMINASSEGQILQSYKSSHQSEAAALYKFQGNRATDWACFKKMLVERNT